MRLGRRWWSSVAMAVLVLLGAGPSHSQPTNTLVVGLVAEPVALDPAQVTDLNSNRVGRRVVETLVAFAEESTQLVPGLAESWTISKDGLTYTFKLRKGIAFHDGTPFNAQAVKFSIERQINPEHPANKLGKYPFAGYFFGNVPVVKRNFHFVIVAIIVISIMPPVIELLRARRENAAAKSVTPLRD